MFPSGFLKVSRKFFKCLDMSSILCQRVRDNGVLKDSRIE